jgi:hypothetical protein
VPVAALVREEVWSSKADAGAWALEHAADPALVAEALASRGRGRILDPARAAAFVDGVLAEMG